MVVTRVAPLDHYTVPYASLDTREEGPRLEQIHAGHDAGRGYGRVR
jgi:hypothetical protein